MAFAIIHVISFLLAISTIVPEISAEECNNDKVIFCYYSSWAIYRPKLGSYSAEDIDPLLCTHLIYGFAGLNVEGLIFSLDPKNDLPENGGNQQFYTFRQIKEKNQCLKTLLSLGGWNEGSEKFSVIAETPESRRKFVDHLIMFIIYYGFDGIDIDWEYPTQRGGIKSDKENYVSLLKDIKARFEPRDKMLCVAVGASLDYVDTAYDVKSISEIVDYVLLMAYDYNRLNTTSYMAPLFRKPGDINSGSISESVDGWLSSGCPPGKLVLGLQTSGRTYTLDKQSSKPEENGVGSVSKGEGNAGPYTNTTGLLSYYEICDMMNEESGWYLVSNDDIYASSFATKDDQWIAFEDVNTINIKTQYALSKSLGGVMIWTLDTDDFRGICSEEENILLKTVNSVLISYN